MPLRRQSVLGRANDPDTSSLPHDSPALSDLSPRDKPWDKHRGNCDRATQHYRGSEFNRYADRMTFCSEFLGFGFEGTDDGEVRLKLRTARFCRVRHCPVCQWRRSLMWKAKAYKVLPTIIRDYPRHRWLFLTLTQRNCPISELRKTLKEMNRSWQRLIQRKAWPAAGWIRSTEVTRGKYGDAHPHFHCLLLVPPIYFSGKGYLKQADWVALWRTCARLDYNPVLDIQAVKRGNEPMSLVPELLKYCVKESDLVCDREWFLELTRQMKSLRCVATGGVLKEYLRELEQDPDDLIGQGDTSDSSDSEAQLYFGWNRPEKRYRLKS